MSKIIEWILSLTKVGKLIQSTQVFLDGKKQMLASLATAIPATVVILTKFSEQGVPYLLHIVGTPEYLAASLGWIGLFNAIKGEKIRQENAQIIAGQEAQK